MNLYDTLTNSEQELDISRHVRIYLCGVTVYDESHIGHARTIIVFDVLRRYLEKKDVAVKFIQNFTDVDDKIISRANSEDTTAKDISTRYINSYFKDFDMLGIRRATNYPKATEHIDDIIRFIEKLIKKQIAYVSANGVYFSVSKFPEYGKLSKKVINDLKSGARIKVDEAKRDPLDFAVWKFSDADPVWDSPWGKGRPGWHIECSAMSIKYLGKNFEIHGGGRDLIFPHHENEIAQSESYDAECPFAKIWMHVGMVTINGEKMSKSLGNIRSVRHVLENWGPNVVRLFCLSGHYSKPISYTEELLRESLTKWRQIEACYYEMRFARKTLERDDDVWSDMQENANRCANKFYRALESNLNTHEALAAFFDFVRVINESAADDKLDCHAVDGFASAIFEDMMSILGLRLGIPDGDERRQIDNLIAQRSLLRRQKRYENADELRDVIQSRYGVEIIDHKDRTVWIKREGIRAES